MKVGLVAQWERARCPHWSRQSGEEGGCAQVPSLVGELSCPVRCVVLPKFKKKMEKMVSFLLCVFYHHFKSFLRKTDGGKIIWGASKKFCRILCI